LVAGAECLAATIFAPSLERDFQLVVLVPVVAGILLVQMVLTALALKLLQ